MDLQNLILITTTALGFTTLSIIFLKFLNWIWKMFLRPPKNLKSYGSWALITGSTDGIGKALAFQLASKGFNLILIARNPIKLETTANEIQNKYPTNNVQVKTIVIDFAKHGRDEIAKAVEEGILGLDLGILINNVGFCYPYARFFHEVDLELMESVVKVNVEGTTLVTKAVLRAMMKKKKGVVVNIGSGSSGFVSSYPLYAVYAATKAYIAQFSKCIGLEYKEYGIDVQCQIPLLVATKMASIRKSSLFIPSAETFSKASLRWIGYDTVCVPYWSHYLQCCIVNLMPDSLQDWCLYHYFVGIRNRGLKKDSINAKAKAKNSS